MIDLSFNKSYFYLKIDKNDPNNSFISRKTKLYKGSETSSKYTFLCRDTDYVKILNAFKTLHKNNIKFNISDTALERLQQLVNYDNRSMWKQQDVAVEHIEGIKVDLAPYQYTGIKFLEDAGGRGVIALHTGDGKTLVSLGYCIKNNKKAIIICPSQAGKTKRSLAEEIHNNTTKRPIIIGGGTDFDLVKFDTADFVIINYEQLATDKINWIKTLIKNHNFDTIIIDESHKVKSIKTATTKNVRELAYLCKHRILLSATAMENNPKELWTQLNLVAPERFPDYSIFRTTYFGKPVYKNGCHFFQKVKDGFKQLHIDIQGIWFYREEAHTKKDIPKPIVYLMSYNKPDENLIENKQQQRHQLANLMIPNTLKQTRTLLEDNTSSKIVVYSYFVDIVEELYGELQEVAVINHGRLQGKVQQDNYMRFKTDPDIRVMVSTIDSLKESVNLQNIANRIVVNDLPYKSTTLEQIFGRLVRRGTTDICKFFLMVFNFTYHDRMLEILQEKLSLIGITLKGKDQTLEAVEINIDE